MLGKTIVDLLNSQVNKEFFSSYLYLDMSNFFMLKGLNGFGHWFAVQSKEEYDHALLFVKYLQNNGEEIHLEPIAAPNENYIDFRKVLEVTLEHEIQVSQSINEIYAEASSLKDFKTMQFLDWFVKEQGEEEQNADNLCRRFDLFGTDARGLYLLDNELLARVYAAPTLVL